MQTPSQPRQDPGHAYLHGAMRDTDCFTDFHVAQAKEVPHQQLAAHESRQLAQTLLQRPSFGGAIHIHHDIRLSNEPIQYVEVVHDALSPTMPQLIHAAVVGDAAQPSPQATTLLEFFNSMKHAEKYLLADVVGDVTVADNPEDKPGDRTTIRGHQNLQRVVSPAATYASERGFFSRSIDARFRGRTVGPDRRTTNRGGIFHWLECRCPTLMRSTAAGPQHVVKAC